jgi:hypothetical protein
MLAAIGVRMFYRFGTAVLLARGRADRLGVGPRLCDEDTRTQTVVRVEAAECHDELQMTWDRSECVSRLWGRGRYDMCPVRSEVRKRLKRTARGNPTTLASGGTGA